MLWSFGSFRKKLRHSEPIPKNNFIPFSQRAADTFSPKWDVLALYMYYDLYFLFAKFSNNSLVNRWRPIPVAASDIVPQIYLTKLAMKIFILSPVECVGRPGGEPARPRRPLLPRSPAHSEPAAPRPPERHEKTSRRGKQSNAPPSVSIVSRTSEVAARTRE